MKTIYNTYVVMESQEQCDRMKQLCIDNELPIWDDSAGWHLFFCGAFFSYSEKHKEFFCFVDKSTITFLKYKKVTEEEFIELLTQSSE